MPHFENYARQEMLPPPDNAYCAESNNGEILGVTGFFFGLASLNVMLRISVRTFMVKCVGADDYVMIWAWLMALGTFICFVAETKYAVGKHLECIPKDDYEMYFRWQYYHSIWVMIGVVLAKISVAMFLMRLVPPGKKWKHFLWAVMIFLICFCLACLGTLVFSCIPIRANWDFAVRAEPSTRCFSNSTYSSIGLMNSSINCVTDFTLALVPIPVVVKLQVNKRTKITLAIILSLGYFACAAGIVKAVKQHDFFNEKDPFWHDDFNVWNMIELCVGIVAASLPALRPLVAKILEGTKHIMSAGSWHSSRDRTAGESTGYRKQRDQVTGPDGAVGDIKLHEWKDFEDSQGDRSVSKTVGKLDVQDLYSPVASPRNTVVTATSSKEFAPPYGNSVCVTATRDFGDDGSWDSVELVRSQSEETLHRTRILKTTEIASSGDLVDNGDENRWEKTVAGLGNC